LAALVLLNDPTFVEAARVFASRILVEGGSTTEDRLRFAFIEAVSRFPSPNELDVFNKLLEKSRDEFREDADSARSLVSVGLQSPPEQLDQIDLAVWTVVARAMLSLNEAITRF